MMKFRTVMLTMTLGLVTGASPAGEIVLNAPVVAPQASDSKADKSVKRAKGQLGRTDEAPPGVDGMMLDDAGEVELFPQHGGDSLPDGKARYLSNKAKEQQSGEALPPLLDGLDVIDLPPESAAREGVANNVSKARAYMKNSGGQPVGELPVVSCAQANNVSGRIGDDSLSGSIVTVMYKGRPVKARCK